MAITTLQNEIDWLTAVINQVITSYLKQEGYENNWQDITPPDVSGVNSFYANKVNEWSLNVYERLALALAITPHIRPDALDIFFGKNQMYDRGFTEFGGVVNDSLLGFFCFFVTTGNRKNY
ncbi:MAG: hypothetical protein COA88_07255 [Kordia sp.]|nr:MAG: hypothetical protein COA88_07255 [Kordia sp.]